MEVATFDQSLAGKIDHTLLKPDATSSDIHKLCKEALAFSFAAVCVPPYYVNLAAQQLAGTKVKVATVIGFPLGYHLTYTKLHEIERAAELGATEMDMVINLSALKNADWSYLAIELHAAAELTHQKLGNLLKVIIETALLTPDEIVKVCHICEEANVDFVKTSTGFSGGGATVEAVQLMRKSLPPHISIKASGGIRTKQDALAMINAGADRLGCSASVQIVSLPTN